MTSPRIDRPRKSSLIQTLLAAAILVLVAVPNALANQLARSAEELADLEQRIDALSKTLTREAEEEGSLTAALDAAEQRLTELKRSIRDQRNREAALEVEFSALEAEAGRLTMVAEDASERLGMLLRSGYMLGRQSGLRMLVNQQDPHKAARRMAMFRYVVAARNRQLAEIAELDQRLEVNRDQLEDSRLQLASTRRELEQSRAALDEQQQVRNRQLEDLRLSMAEKSGEIALYKERQQALEQLMVELRLPPPKPKPKPEPAPDRTPKPAPVAPGLAREPQQPTQTAVSASPGAGPSRPAMPAEQPASQPPADAQDIAVQVRAGFANNRGALPRPLEAKIRARFGDRRQGGGLEWQGVLFGARDGQAVRAVYPGQVVFSDWFRGFGQLMVVEHGDGYMSLYGHNQSLNANVGDSVSAGQVIATASDEAAVPVAGLYFEIRHNGTPDDPLQWIR